MLEIMLCGASDMVDVAPGFIDVTRQFGGEPWQYLSGEIQYLNSATSSWQSNSRKSVAKADLCVFVILRRYGEITWSDELDQALDDGKPFIILCLASTYQEYLSLTRYVSTAKEIVDPDRRKLVETLSELERERQLTVVSFEMGSFTDIYRREMARLFDASLESLQRRSQRESYAGLMGNPERLTARDLLNIEVIATDEFEEKGLRKLAINALASRGAASDQAILSLLGSSEQGVQRLATHLLPDLYQVRPPDLELLDDCVAVANASDDVGVARRLIPALFKIDVLSAINALGNLDLSEIGARRRLRALDTVTVGTL